MLCYAETNWLKGNTFSACTSVRYASLECIVEKCDKICQHGDRKIDLFEHG